MVKKSKSNKNNTSQINKTTRSNPLNRANSSTTKKHSPSPSKSPPKILQKNSKKTRVPITLSKETTIVSKRKEIEDAVYIPPHKRKKAEALEKLVPNSPQYQRRAWQALKGSINICINKADPSNIHELVIDLFNENLLWGKGLLCRALIRSQMAAPGYSNVLAAIAAVVNTKLPEIGELLVKRLIHQFQRSYRRNDKIAMHSLVVFFAHLVNQYVVHEVVALELLSLLLERPTDDSVEVAIAFVKQCGARLSELISEGVHAVFETFRAIISEGKVTKRVQYSIEGLYQVYRDKFRDFPAIIPSLDLVNEEDAIVHEFHIKDKHDIEEIIDVFRPMDPNSFKEQEKLYEELKNDILADSSSEEDEIDQEEKNSEPVLIEENDEINEKMVGEKDLNAIKIEDKTATELTNLRRNIYLTIMSSLNFEEAAHKLLKIKVKSGDEPLVSEMILDCCANERTYQRDFGMLAERFCKCFPPYADAFDNLFGQQYTIIHRYETAKLRNIAKLFAHLIFSQALGWDVLEYIRLTEQDTTSSSRIFIKTLFQELAYWMGAKALKNKIEEDILRKPLQGIFPRGRPKDTRFSINFFTSIGLGVLTTGLREHLEQIQQKIRENKEMELNESSSEENSSSDEDSSSENSSSEDSSDDDDSSTNDEDSSSSEESSSESDDSSSSSSNDEDSSSNDEESSSNDEESSSNEDDSSDEKSEN